MSPLPHGFFRIFISGRYHRDMKIPKILASNSKQFRVYGILKQLQIDDDKCGGKGGGGWGEGGDYQIQKFHRWLHISSGLEKSPGFLF